MSKTVNFVQNTKTEKMKAALFTGQRDKPGSILYLLGGRSTSSQASLMNNYPFNELRLIIDAPITKKMVNTVSTREASP